MYAQPAHAGIFDFVWNTMKLGDLIGAIAGLWVSFLGSLLTAIFIPILIGIAQFNQFLNIPIVSTGWALARDVANMFFIVVLLIIAFSTILRIESYHYKRALSKLLIMAVLVNFSKLIAGFLIDFAQVIMLTFVNAFKGAAAGNFAHAFKLYDLLAFASGVDPLTGSAIKIEARDALLAYILSVVMIFIASAIILIFILVLLYRIIMLWILIILSPLAYLSYAISPRYWSQWWGEFFKHLVSGPVIAFFLWLVLMTVQTTDNNKGFIPLDVQSGEVTVEENVYVFGNKASAPQAIFNFMVMAAMLIGTLAVSQKMAQQSGDMVGNLAGKIASAGKKGAFVGMGGAALYKWGSRRYQAYKGMREQGKQEKAQRFAAGAMRLSGGVKQAAALPARKLALGIHEMAGKGNYERAKKEYDKANLEVKKLERNGVTSGEEYDQAQERLRKAEEDKKKARMRSWIGGAVLARPLTEWLSRTVGKAGASELKQVKFFKANEVSKYMQELRELSSDQIDSIIEDPTQDKYRRAAAIFEQTSRGMSDLSDMKRYREMINQFGGHDSVLNARFEKIVDEKYPAASLRTMPLTKALKLKINQISELDKDSLMKELPSVLESLVERTTIRDEDGKEHEIVNFNTSALMQEMARMSEEKRGKMLQGLGSHARFGKGVTKDGAIEALTTLARFDKLDVARMSDEEKNKVVQYISKNSAEFERNLRKIPDNLSPSVLKLVNEAYSVPEFVRFHTTFKPMTRQTDGKLVDSYLVERVVDMINKADEETFEANKGLIMSVLSLSGKSGALSKITDESRKNKIIEELPKSKMFRTNAISQAEFGSEELSDKDRKALIDRVLKEHDFGTIEGAINKSVIDNRDKIHREALLDRIRELVEETIAQKKSVSEIPDHILKLIRSAQRNPMSGLHAALSDVFEKLDKYEKEK